MGNYRLTEEAKADLIRIHHYGMRNFGENQADNYYMAFFEQFEKISDNPYQYQSVDSIRKGYRRCVCGADSIYFRILGDMVEIISIIGRQDFEKILPK